ncbi:hypothetical protein Scep_017350 [Stephania cephalantha]|uniref:Uncharacterized protein n=1 Tax=Stephania cephalantha TaxID=152367 RepID=A0AAP0NTG9_9MAGN
MARGRPSLKVSLQRCLGVPDHYLGLVKVDTGDQLATKDPVDLDSGIDYGVLECVLRSTPATERDQDAKGTDVDLSTNKGKALLIVNVASQWYDEIFACSRSLEILAFPCNRFGGREPRNERADCLLRYKTMLWMQVFGPSDAVDFVQQHLKDMECVFLTGFKPNVDALEMLLGAYFAQIEGTLNQLSTAKLQRRRHGTQTTPDQPVDAEAVYYKVAGDLSQRMCLQSQVAGCRESAEAFGRGGRGGGDGGLGRVLGLLGSLKWRCLNRQNWVNSIGGGDGVKKYAPGGDDDDFDGEWAEDEAGDGGEEDGVGGDFFDRFGVVANERGGESRISGCFELEIWCPTRGRYGLAEVLSSLTWGALIGEGSCCRWALVCEMRTRVQLLGAKARTKSRRRSGRESIGGHLEAHQGG